jgi:HD-GYP domain-containing protein (c-di-GMP phosphodiesterase class II)
MQFSPLSAVKQRVQVGRPLPFNVRNNDATLLLAKGHIVETHDQMEALFTRGALVDIAELRTPTDAVKLATAKELPGLWNQSLNKLSQTLQDSGKEGFIDALEESTPVVLALVERDKDLAIFQVLRQEGNEFVQYGVNHSTHAAITAYLVAQRLGWAADDALKAFKTALTMNISMLELQGQMALQTGPLSTEQREALHAHPEFSRRMLEISGVTDSDWLTAVEQHHEDADGKGYPYGLTQVSDIAVLVRRADIYTAKLSPRAGRDAIAADKAGRMMFMQDPGHPMTAALVKEFGVYPPGCFVKLMTGETGLVVKRGPTVMTPVVAVLTSPYGNNLPQPVRRDTSQREFAIHSVLGGNAGRTKLSPELMLAALAE